MVRRSFYPCLVLFAMTFFVLPCLLSCKPSIPSDILSEGTMEDILYDYHLSQATVETERLSSVEAYSYRLAVLKKYGVSQAEFDSSMVYYTRHTELLKNIYENIYDRLNSEAVSLGATASDLDKFGAQAEKGDTANIWTGGRAMVLPAAEPFNYSSFAIEADTTFHKGDRFLLEFDTQFIMQDGSRNGIAVLAIRFANDSVTSQYMRVSNSQHYSLMVEDKDSLGLKKVSGYFMFNNPSSQVNTKTTLKLMVLQNIKLIKMHVRDRKPATRPTPAKVIPPVSDTLKTTAAPQQLSPSTQPPLTAPVKPKVMPVNPQRRVQKE